jgi:hypothetical protein
MGGMGAIKSHLCFAPLASLAHPCMHESPPSCILFLGWNKGIGMEGWAAMGRALSSKKNLKKLALGKESVTESSSDPDHLKD